VANVKPVYMETKKYFGEFAYYIPDNLEEKQKAIEYLKFWKKNLLFKLQRDSFDVKILHEDWIEREALYVSSFSHLATVGLKLCLEADFHYELGK
jgi:hypothetical protein